MLEEVHKYYCEDCRIFLFAASPARLAVNLNGHNQTHHPTYSDLWTAISIVRSSHYTQTEFAGQPAVKSRPAQTIPPGSCEWGNAKSAPEITEQDREWLSKALVRW